MAPLALVQNLVIRWHHMHKFQIWLPDGATWISSKLEKFTTQFTESIIPWVRCTSGNVFFISTEGALWLYAQPHQSYPIISREQKKTELREMKKHFQSWKIQNWCDRTNLSTTKKRWETSTDDFAHHGRNSTGTIKWEARFANLNPSSLMALAL